MIVLLKDYYMDLEIAIERAVSLVKDDGPYRLSDRDKQAIEALLGAVVEGYEPNS